MLSTGGHGGAGSNDCGTIYGAGDGGGGGGGGYYGGGGGFGGNWYDPSASGLSGTGGGGGGEGYITPGLTFPSSTLGASGWADSSNESDGQITMSYILPTTLVSGRITTPLGDGWAGRRSASRGPTRWVMQ